MMAVMMLNPLVEAVDPASYIGLLMTKWPSSGLRILVFAAPVTVASCHCRGGRHRRHGVQRLTHLVWEASRRGVPC